MGRPQTDHRATYKKYLNCHLPYFCDVECRKKSWNSVAIIQKKLLTLTYYAGMFNNKELLYLHFAGDIYSYKIQWSVAEE